METANANPGTPAERDARTRQWRDAKFGMFIHWGLYSIPAGVWNGKTRPGNYAEHIQLRARIRKAEYAKLADQFNPVQFDADAWVELAKQAGMRHIVITAKHQDGFAMYASDVSDFNVVDATPFGRDPMKELADAARRQGLGFGFYYSHARDHHHRLANWNAHGNTWDFPQATKEDFIRYLDEKAKPQIEELLTGYGDLAVMWFDVPCEQGRMPAAQCRANRGRCDPPTQRSASAEDGDMARNQRRGHLRHKPESVCCACLGPRYRERPFGRCTAAPTTLRARIQMARGRQDSRTERGAERHQGLPAGGPDTDPPEDGAEWRRCANQPAARSSGPDLLGCRQ